VQGVRADADALQQAFLVTDADHVNSNAMG
jgi:hypothetical protein